MIKIGLDMMGGDYAPLEAVKGVSAFLQENSKDVHLVLIGDEEQIKQHIEELCITSGQYSIVHAYQVIELY